MCAQTGQRKGWVTQTNRLLPGPPGPHSKEGLLGGTLLDGDEFPASGAVPYTPVCKELPRNVGVRGHRGVDLITL